jgi:hypothetical protein
MVFETDKHFAKLYISFLFASEIAIYCNISCNNEKNSQKNCVFTILVISLHGKRMEQKALQPSLRHCNALFQNQVEAMRCPWTCIIIGRVGIDWETHQTIQNTEVASSSNGGPRLRKSQDTAHGNLESVDYKGG